MVIDIREVSQQDKAQWLQLWEGYTRFYGSPQPTEVTEYTWQRMLDAASPMLGRFAVVDGNVVGFAICILHEGTWVKTPICYLEDLFVSEDVRGKHIGKQLIEYVQQQARKRHEQDDPQRLGQCEPDARRDRNHARAAHGHRRGQARGAAPAYANVQHGRADRHRQRR